MRTIHKRAIILFFPVVMVVQGLAAQPVADTLTIGSLQEAIARALKSNPTQAVYVQQIRQARYDYQATKGIFYPNASGAFSGTDNLHLSTTPIPGALVGAPGTTYYAQFGKKYIYNTGVTLTQTIFDWQAVLATKIANSNLRLTELQQASYVQTMKEQVARTYFSVLIAKVSLDIVSADQQASDSLVALSRQRLQEGTTDALAVNQAVINGNNVRQNKAQSQQLYDQGLENLKILLAVSPRTEIRFIENLRPDSLINAGFIAPGADKNLDVYRQQVYVAELQRQAQRAVAYPSLSASAYLGLQQFRDDFGMSFANNAWTGYRYIGLNLNIPLFTGLANTYKYKSAVTRASIAQLQYGNASDQSAINDQLLVKNQDDYLAMARASFDNFGLYAENLRLDRQKYQEGVIAMDVYQRAFQDYLAAENTYMNNLSQLLSVRATLIARQ